VLVTAGGGAASCPAISRWAASSGVSETTLSCRPKRERVQAKRYTGVVGLEAVHALTGVMADHNATTGVLHSTDDTQTGRPGPVQ